MPDTYSIKPPIYNISHANTNVDFVTKKDTFCDTLHIHFNSIHLKYTHISKLPDFVRVQQLHSPCAFVEVVFEGDAAAPGLDFRRSLSIDTSSMMKSWLTDTYL